VHGQNSEGKHLEIFYKNKMEETVLDPLHWKIVMEGV